MASELFAQDFRWLGHSFRGASALRFVLRACKTIRRANCGIGVGDLWFKPSAEVGRIVP